MMYGISVEIRGYSCLLCLYNNLSSGDKNDIFENREQKVEMTSIFHMKVSNFNYEHPPLYNSHPYQRSQEGLFKEHNRSR